MKPILIKDIMRAARGTLLWGNAGAEVDHVIIDSREAAPGVLFVPLIGERVDAHRFIPDVLEKGAACTFTSDAGIRGGSGAGIHVVDTLQALQDLAACYRNTVYASCYRYLRKCWQDHHERDDRSSHGHEI